MNFAFDHTFRKVHTQKPERTLFSSNCWRPRPSSVHLCIAAERSAAATGVFRLQVGSTESLQTTVFLSWHDSFSHAQSSNLGNSQNTRLVGKTQSSHLVLGEVAELVELVHALEQGQRRRQGTAVGKGRPELLC